MGPDAFKKIGSESSSGTKTFALTGHVLNTGLIEVPFGTTLGEIVNTIGGGVTGADGQLSGKPFKAVQIGGAVRRAASPRPTSRFRSTTRTWPRWAPWSVRAAWWS